MFYYESGHGQSRFRVYDHVYVSDLYENDYGHDEPGGLDNGTKLILKFGNSIKIDFQ